MPARMKGPLVEVHELPRPRWATQRLVVFGIAAVLMVPSVVVVGRWLPVHGSDRLPLLVFAVASLTVLVAATVAVAVPVLALVDGLAAARTGSRSPQEARVASRSDLVDARRGGRP